MLRNKDNFFLKKIRIIIFTLNCKNSSRIPKMNIHWLVVLFEKVNGSDNLSGDGSGNTNLYITKS